MSDKLETVLDKIITLQPASGKNKLKVEKIKNKEVLPSIKCKIYTLPQLIKLIIKDISKNVFEIYSEYEFKVDISSLKTNVENYVDDKFVLLQDELEEEINGMASFDINNLKLIHDVNDSKEIKIVDTLKEEIIDIEYEVLKRFIEVTFGKKELDSYIARNSIYAVIDHTPQNDRFDNKFIQDLHPSSGSSCTIYKINTYKFPEFYRHLSRERAKFPKDYKDFLTHLFPDKKSYYYVLLWIRELLFGRNECVLILTGPRGSGKSIFMSDFLGALVGKANTKKAKSDLFTGAFNSELYRTKLLIFEEFKLHSDDYTRFKDLANRLQVINMKNRKEKQYEGYHNNIFAVNDVADLYISSDERRSSYPILAENKLEVLWPVKRKDNGHKFDKIQEFKNKLRDDTCIDDKVAFCSWLYYELLDLPIVKEYGFLSTDKEFDKNTPLITENFYDAVYRSLPEYQISLLNQIFIDLKYYLISDEDKPEEYELELMKVKDKEKGFIYVLDYTSWSYIYKAVTGKDRTVRFNQIERLSLNYLFRGKCRVFSVINKVRGYDIHVRDEFVEYFKNNFETFKNYLPSHSAEIIEEEEENKEIIEDDIDL